MRHDAGSSLIESLAALAVFAIGSACHGAWTLQSMATHARASRLIAATTIAVSLEARMRANPAGVLAGDYGEGNASRGRCAEGCDARRQASHDLASFRALLTRRIGPAASGHVACAENGECAIAIAWMEHEILRWVFRP
ncbi:hypothetical protein [Luteibacter yeojuensis]|uniref:Uncharacterized protein n=1 Tax=Luteibacter yeojuensis TaxID=345309 RepID=A0A7X5QRY2_9GAMM|nr:hypothetical protein [Luteibacter yeojuensis]NID14303.1 hypothetical protein [Luteibacter yeojuensis]